MLKAQLNMNIRINFNDSIYVQKYKPEDNDFKYKFVEIEPGDYRVVNATLPRILNHETITQIDLVYSDFPQGEDFSELNRKRIIE